MEAANTMERELLRGLWPKDDFSEFPCGTLRCTWEEYPKILNANRQMLQLLGVTEGDADWSGFIRDNVYFMLPFEERGEFRRCLREAEETLEPVALEHNVHKGTGGLIKLNGWVRLNTDERGNKEYHFLYMELPKSHQLRQNRRERAYQQILIGAYDLIFQIHTGENTIECMHQGEGVEFPFLQGARVILSGLMKHEWFARVCENDRKQVAAYFSLITEHSGLDTPMEITFRIQKGEEIREYHAVTSGLDERTNLLCVRDVTGDEQPDSVEERPVYRSAEAGGRPRVRIRTFGYFDVFVDDQPVIFRYEKSKEMLAILVDRKGGFVANPYFITCLWENEPYSEKIQGRCRQTVYRMMETLKKYGIEDIVEKVDGKRRIVPEKVDCDYFNYLRGEATPDQLFGGAYMSDYSWGESTLSSLIKNFTDHTG